MMQRTPHPKLFRQTPAIDRISHGNLHIHKRKKTLAERDNKNINENAKQKQHKEDKNPKRSDQKPTIVISSTNT